MEERNQRARGLQQQPAEAQFGFMNDEAFDERKQTPEEFSPGTAYHAKVAGVASDDFVAPESAVPR